MSKHMVHVLVPNTSEAACGIKGFAENAGVRESITCRRCRKTDHFKSLGNAKKVKR